ncbi:MAG: ABC transporter ATP-binding protein [bacterium]
MVDIVDIVKRFENKVVLNGVSLHIPAGETMVIIGQSGCGKTVLLKSIIGLIKPEKGSISIDGEDITALSQRELYEKRKKMGMLFQGAALFDSMTVEENIGLPLKYHKNLSNDIIREKVSEKLRLVGLSGIGEKKPAELSGGMKKRVGLARALIMDPELVLYDEPTTGLDPIRANSINNLIVETQGKLDITSIAVTHDLISAKKIGNRVAMLSEGNIVFEGTFDELENSNKSVVKRFIHGII